MLALCELNAVYVASKTGFRNAALYRLKIARSSNILSAGGRSARSFLRALCVCARWRAIRRNSKSWCDPLVDVATSRQQQMTAKCGGLALLRDQTMVTV